MLINRKKYKQNTFWLLFGSLLSILFYIVCDDENNIFVKNSDWFLFDSSLFITFLFLFVKYYKNGKEVFLKRDFLFFIPSLIYFIIESIEIKMGYDCLPIEIIETLTELTFVVYLFLIIYIINTTKRKHWSLYFAIPIMLLFTFSILNEIIGLLDPTKELFINNQYFNTSLLLIVAFLFYFITFKLITKDNQLLPSVKVNKYKNSKLNSELIKKYKTEIIHIMETEKLYLNNKLSMDQVSKKLNIPRQYISEILNIHMNISFQDFINQYRVDEFISRLKNNQNNHFTLLAIAMEVGFSSKSSFNSTFKKIKGLTPSEYKKTLIR
ncbi:AraC-like DNA-binding protein [Wenyingzhuangia heitensis]|uniref:AraC-like DNA-binding protein n=2 Tax=Wenyingzhuangia heitensis TaxID=1487859 RepID=A0ABX0UBV2_9FLAO|nr:AraC-like DNA-binding protein [Wenyingzhuangia heitensis]